MGITKSFTTRFCNKITSSCAYDSRLLLVKACLVLLDALLAAEEHKAVPHVESVFLRAVFFDQLVDALVDAVLVAAVVGIKLRVGALRQVAHQAQRVDDDALALGQGGRACDREGQHLGRYRRFIEILPVL